MQHAWSQASVGYIWKFRQIPFFYATAENMIQLCNLNKKRSTAAALFAGWTPCPIWTGAEAISEKGYHAPWALRDKHDKARFFQLSRNRVSCRSSSGNLEEDYEQLIISRSLSDNCFICVCRLSIWKTADQVSLRLLKLMDVFLIIRRHVYTLQDFIIRTLAFRFLLPTLAVCFSPFSSMSAGKY